MLFSQAIAAVRSGDGAPAALSMREGWSAEADVLSSAEWDRLSAGFGDMTFDQTASGVDERWGRGRVSRLLLRRDGVPVAGAQAVILNVPVISQGLAYVKFGPFWRRRGGAPDPEVYRAAVSALMTEYCARRGHCLTILPRPNPQHLPGEAAILEELGFRQRRPMNDPNRYLVNVAIGSAEQMKSLDQKWRYNLRQAQRHGIECRMSGEAGDLAAFSALHAAMESRKGFRESDAVAALPALRGGLPEAMRPRVTLALHEGTPVAGAVVALLGDTAYYALGASSDAALPLKAGYALQWWIVNWLADKGVRWYDLGGEVLEPGLRQFKKGLVGKSGAILAMPGEFDTWTHPVGRWVADGLYAVRAARGAVQALRKR